MNQSESFYFYKPYESENWSSSDSLQKICHSSWSVINYLDDNAVKKFSEKHPINPTLLAALTDPDIRPRFIKLDDSQLLLFLKAINLNPNAEPEDMVSLRIYFDGSNLTCFRNRRLQTISSLRDSIGNENNLNVKEIFTSLLHQLVNRIELQITKLANRIDEMEEALEKNQSPNYKDLESTRFMAAKLWRYLAPQQEVLKRLSQSEFEWSSESIKSELQELEDNITYLVEELSLVRERSELIENRLDSQLTQKVNKNLYLISIITAIFLPISFLTGLLGINIGGMPGVESNTAFWIFCSILFTLAVAEIIYLKKNKWF